MQCDGRCLRLLQDELLAKATYTLHISPLPSLLQFEKGMLHQEGQATRKTTKNDKHTTSWCTEKSMAVSDANDEKDRQW